MFARSGLTTPPCQVRSEHPSNLTFGRRAHGAGHACPVRSLGGRFQPALDVEQQPPAVRVLPDRAHHEAVIEIIEEAPDVQINDPVVSPAPLACDADRLKSGFPRPVPVRIRVEVRLHSRLQVQLRHRLCDPISYSGRRSGSVGGSACSDERGNPEGPLSSARLRYHHRANGRREVRAGRHAIPGTV